MGVSNKGDVVKFRMIGVAAACVGLLLAGCGTPAADTTTSSPTASVAPKTVPDVVGKPFAEAHNTLVGAGLKYEAVGADGVKFTGRPLDTAQVISVDPAAGGDVQATEVVTLKVDSTQGEAKAVADAKEAAKKRAIRYDFRCSTSGSAITAKDNQLFSSPQMIWASASFPKLKSCDLKVGGTWYRDRFTLEPDEVAIVQQVGADGGDISLPSGTFGSVLMLCALPPEEGWDTKYGEYPAGGPKIRSEAKAALAMCPDAPFAGELARVAGGTPPAPKTAMGDGTFVVGRDIAAGSFQVSVPSGANGVHDCYWERTGPQGGTIANDFISFAPQGPVVTVYPGEGFVSRSCGSWTKVG
ncbi:PASTA domain-containing protein [Arthrobacter sp. UYCo732]|uniref:PASTA domain-containing protein n=1 Tax=Arthrobacter sp. UYCo732 TaxID=3156336 RepID=UPI003393CB77